MRAYMDVETTGFMRRKGARIIEIGAVVVSDDWQEIAALSVIVNPGPEALKSPEAYKALAVNKISPQLVEVGVGPATAAASLRAVLRQVKDKNFHAFNSGFDSKFLEMDPWKIPLSVWGDCVMQAANKIMKLGKMPRLGEAAAHFKVEMPDAHRALSDARAAMQIHREILK